MTRSAGYSARCHFLPLLLALLAVAVPVRRISAQIGPPKPNVLGPTGGFEQIDEIQDNLWDGVSSEGTLANPTYSAKVITENGSFSGLAMPPAVAFVDLNGDGKPDLVTADPTGFFRLYANSGTLTEPKFTTGQVIPVFVSTPFQLRGMQWDFMGNPEVRFCPRFSLADWRHTGLLDLLVGNYYGEILFIPNSGSNRRPQYVLPSGIVGARVATNDQGRYWGNLFSPVAYDWNGDGKLDLLMGEGTYSANAVHLLLNHAEHGDPPKFAPNVNNTYVAYGDGREQLLPTVVDFDGDGNPDLLIADRTGEVGVYLNPGRPQPGVELKRSATISFGGTTKLPGLCSIYAADYNGDGLFDLILGLPNGHIDVSLNTGTKGHPTFGPLQEIKGTDRLLRNVKPPTGWSTDTWSMYGNALAYFSVVNAQDDPDSKPVEGSNCLKVAYWPSVQPDVPMPVEGIPGSQRRFTLSRGGITLDAGKRYNISFKVKASGMTKLAWTLRSFFHDYVGATKVDRGERGAATVSGQMVDDFCSVGSDFSAGSNWSTIQSDFVPKWKNPALRNQKTLTFTLYVDFWAADLNSKAYLDDFRITEEAQ
jgi:hypothetical protein